MFQPRTRRQKHVIPSSSESSQHDEAPVLMTSSRGTFNRPSQKANGDHGTSNKSSIPHRLAPHKPTTAPSRPTSSHSSTKQPPPKKPPHQLKKQQAPARTINSFFSAISKEASFASSSTKSTSKDFGPDDDVLYDLIEDDFSETWKTQSKKRGSESQRAGDIQNHLATKKRPWDPHANGTQSTTNGVVSASSKFRKSSTGDRLPTPVAPLKDVRTPEDPRPWTEKYAPRNIQENAVHHKKIADVRRWFDSVLNARNPQKLLVLKGAAGSGKTTTVELLAREMGFGVVEWRNPTTTSSDPTTRGQHVSASSMFEDFMSRAGRFGGLEMAPRRDEPIVHETKAPHSQEPAPELDKKQVILIEEFPSLAGSTSNTSLLNFRSQILQYLSAHSNPLASVPPTVMIISESHVSHDSPSDSFTAHRILGGEILHHPGTAVLEFNAVAPTFIRKALTLVLQKNANSNGGKSTFQPTPAILEALSTIGDLRNATSTLEFLSSQTSSDATKTLTAAKATKAKSKGRSKKPDPTITSAEDANTISLISLRSSTLGLFHSAGKVLYNKRPDAAATKQLPDLDPTLLIDSAGTSTGTFLSTLHENYLPSCFPATTTTDDPMDTEGATTLTHALACVEELSTSDILGDFSGRHTTSRGRGTNASISEALRLEEIAGEVGVRGIMDALPWPVKRQPICTAGGVKVDAFRMFYPADLKLRNKREENVELVDFLASKAANGSLFADFGAGGENAGVSGVGRKNRKTMVHEMLPYTSMILSAKKGSLASAFQRQVEDVTRFSRCSRVVQGDEEEESAEDDFEKARVKVPFGDNAKDKEMGIDKLVLSDDDIED